MGDSREAKRTRKWTFVAQEAQRLADLQLSQREIARRLGVSQPTVHAWIRTGKLIERRGTQMVEMPIDEASDLSRGQQWAHAVRSQFDLDVTDSELVRLGAESLDAASNPEHSLMWKLQAMTRFQAIVKQLALVARRADAEKPEAPARKTFEATRSVMDPRGILSEAS